MDAQLILSRLGEQIKGMRVRRGLTQSQLARLANTTRQKVAAIETGDGTVGSVYYGKVLAALSAEVQVVPARRPVLEELHEVFG
ncbi:helix-turn-helix transcriptional regulator [Pseudomonas aeruginosa]|uniref:helix-turn-helix transcriptional regulator n=1 Tax=Pseudomonas aeruginosa TaxID=287 RepID=UPI001560CCF1|nr:helix-turn-helix domain-containing protein [Stutzerimonas stutzeri]